MNDYIQSMKPRIVAMVLVTAAIGFLLGGPPDHGAWQKLLFCLLGMAAAAGGSAALNNYLERDVDARMDRTRGRALPAGRMEPVAILNFGVLATLGGVSLLVWKVNLLSGFIVLLTAFLYVLVYTPLKRVSWLNTSIGAIPGALPPVAGWAAATGRLDWGAWVLFAILFAWQHPHFYAIAWIYQRQYAAAGFKMLPVVEPDGERMFRHIIGFAILLLGVSVLPAFMGMAGRVYLAGALGLGLFMLIAGIRMARGRTHLESRQLLRASIIYLPCLLVLIALDAGW